MAPRGSPEGPRLMARPGAYIYLETSVGSVEVGLLEPRNKPSAVNMHTSHLICGKA